MTDLESAEAERAEPVQQLDPPLPTAPAPAPAEVQPPAEKRVRIGSASVPEPWVLSWTNPSCEMCGGRGFIEGRDAKTREAYKDICPRTMSRARVELRKFLESMAVKKVDPPAPAVAQSPIVSRATAALQRQLDEMEQALARRRQIVDDLKAKAAQAEDSPGIVQIDGWGNRATFELQKSERRISEISQERDEAVERANQLRAELDDITGRVLPALNRQIAAYEASRDHAKAQIESLTVKRKALLTSIAGDWENAEANFHRNTDGLRKRIDKVRRRLTMTLLRAGLQPLDRPLFQPPAQTPDFPESQ